MGDHSTYQSVQIIAPIPNKFKYCNLYILSKLMKKSETMNFNKYCERKGEGLSQEGSITNGATPSSLATMHTTNPAIYVVTPAEPMFLWLLHYQLPASAVTAILRQATVRNTQWAWRSCRCVCKRCPYITAALMQGAGGGGGAVMPGRGGISHRLVITWKIGTFTRSTGSFLFLTDPV